MRIHDAVIEFDTYFVQKADALGILGLSLLQKITAALRLFAYGSSCDSVDEYVRIADSTATKCLKRFAWASGQGTRISRVTEDMALMYCSNSIVGCSDSVVKAMLG